MRIEVEPQQVIDAGKQVGSLGTQLGALSDAMGQVLSDGIASGTDPAGLNFGISYGRQSDEFGKQLAQLANAFKSVGLILEATGFNYKSADEASTAGGPGPSGGISGEQAETKAGDAPYAPNGNIVPPPSKWWMIQPFLNMIPLFGVAMTWPTGNAAMMNLTAAQWGNIGRGLKVFEPALTPAATVAGAQGVPEAEQMKTALKDLGEGATKLASFADQMGTTITEFARGVQETQDSIRDILDRLSLDGLWDTVTGFLSGDGDKILREIAEDVGDVLENFQNQVQGVLGLLSELQTLLGEAADSFQRWIRPVLVEAFGDGVGNALADSVKVYTDLQAGLGIAVIGLVSGTVAIADPDTWKGLADTAIMIAKDPTMIDDVLIQSGSEFIAYDAITGDNPARGVGEALGNIGSLFIPGGALAKGGSVAKGLAATRHLLDGGSLGSLVRLPGLGGNRTPDMPELPDAPAAPNIPEFTPPPGIPGSVLSPGGPSSPIPTAPSSGPGSGGGPAPTGPSSNGSGPSQSGGGAGPGSSSSNGSAPAGGSPSPSGSSGGPSSNGAAPTGGSPSTDGPSKPSGGAPVSPSTSGGGSDPGISQKPDAADGHAPSGTGSADDRGSSSGLGTHDGGTNPNSPDNPSHSGDDGSFRPSDEGRIYSLMDDSSHTTLFAPEQLGDNQRVVDVLDRHGVSRNDFVDLIHRPTDSLTPDERSLINSVRDDLPGPTPDTVMQKVIPPGYFDGETLVTGRADDYIMGWNEIDVERVGGAVTVADDTAHLGTPAQIHDGLRLDYENTPFAPHDPGTHIIRFQADQGEPGSYEVPRNSDMGGNGRYDPWKDPFTGNGFTKADDDVVPEYIAKDVTMREGAEMWEVLDDGTQRLVAVLKDKEWIPQGN